MKNIYKIAYILVIVGGLNWLLVGLFNWDIGQIFGGYTAIVSRAVYILVGLSAIYLVATCKNNCQHCEVKMPGNNPVAPNNSI